ncbi:MAG: YhgE/Pip domain-containing protein [Longicatena sp.]
MKEEWKLVLHSTWIKVVLIAIIIIPMVYSGIFLGSMWDPYGNADKMPVAVVNNDEKVNYNNKTMQVGNELVKNLKENKAMDFQFVDESVAKEGLSKGIYYMSITIPKEFSYNATTLLDKSPKKMVLDYATNPGTNYIASKMDESAMSKIKENINASVTKTYADTLFSQVKELSAGLYEASDGTSKLGNGVDQTITGNRTIHDNLQTLASSTLVFRNGTHSLEEGISAYTNGVTTLQTGTKQMYDGVNTLQTKSNTLIGGVGRLQNGTRALRNGVDAYTQGVNEVTTGINQVVTNSAALNQGMSDFASGVVQSKNASAQLAFGVEQLSQGLNTQLSPANLANIKSLLELNNKAQAANTLTQQSHKELIEELKSLPNANTNASIQKAIVALNNDNQQTLYQANNQMISTLENGLLQVQDTINNKGLLTGTKSLHAGLTKLDNVFTGEKGLVNGVKNYTNALTQIQTGTNTLHNKSKELTSGSEQVAIGTNQLNENMPLLVEGVASLSQGASDLNAGSMYLISKNQALLSGVNSLYQGSLQLHAGANLLANGSNTLGTGLLTIKEGTQTLNSKLDEGARSSDVKTTEDTLDMLATPLSLEHHQVSNVENNGKAMAPYMMSVGLYVACMAFTLVYPLLKNTNKTKNGFAMWKGKASIMYTISTIMALLMIGALMLINGLAPEKVVLTFLMACLIAAGFMSLIVFFNIVLGKVGAFLILMFMIFQLGGAAGTYPIETSNTFYNMIHPFMPFTYSVDAFRHTLALGEPAMTDVMIFVGMIVIFSILSIVFYRWKVSISEEQYKDTLLAKFQ